MRSRLELGRRQGDGEARALADATRHIDPAAVCLGELPGDRQAEPGTGLGPLWRLEELVEDERQVSLGDPRPRSSTETAIAVPAARAVTTTFVPGGAYLMPFPMRFANTCRTRFSSPRPTTSAHGHVTRMPRAAMAGDRPQALSDLLDARTERKRRLAYVDAPRANAAQLEQALDHVRQPFALRVDHVNLAAFAESPSARWSV